jgi:hypothetical protein
MDSITALVLLDFVLRMDDTICIVVGWQTKLLIS